MLEIRLEPRTFAFRRAAATSRGALTQRNVLLVWASVGDTCGLGEAGPIAGLSADDDPQWEARARAAVAAVNARRLSPPVDGANVLQAVSALLALLPEVEQLPSLRFGLESALLDLLQGRAGLLFPSAFTRGESLLRTHGLLWMAGAASLLEQAEHKVAAGFTVLKLKIGALPFDEELGLLQALHTRYPHVRLRLDANGSFTPHAAAAALERLASLPIDFVEQPMAPGQVDSLCELSAASPIPIAVDEELIHLHPGERAALLRRLAALPGLPPFAVLKPALLGGLGPAALLADACDELGLPWVVNSMLEAAPGHSAICQWAAACLEKTHQQATVQGIGTGQLFANNLPSPIVLQGNVLRWR